MILLESHIFLKENIDGTIKVRTMAGGNKQRKLNTKECSIWMTVSTEDVLLSCIIDAEEKRDIDIIDIPNAFIPTRV